MFQLFVQHESKWPSEQKYSNTNHLESMKVYENVLKQEKKTFSSFFWESLRILPRYALKALIFLEEGLYQVKNSNTMYVLFCTWCSTKWKNWFRIKGAHLAALPKKASRTMQTDDERWKDLPVRPNCNPHYPSPHISGYIGIRYTAQRIRNPTND